jgi:N-acetylglutamate synthase-like GNAT family acetyltransferase
VKLRFASEADLPEIQHFIDSYWKKGHILSHDSALLRWQHQSTENKLNFVLCLDNSEILGLLGFIESSRFDPRLSPPALSLALWKVRDDRTTTGVGVALVRYLKSNHKSHQISTIGVADDAQKLLAVLGFTIGEMSHHAVFNPTCSIFKLASGPPTVMVGSTVTEKSSIVVEDLSASTKIGEQIFISHNETYWPVKSWAYIEERFLRHPKYRYKTIRFRTDGLDRTVLFCREIEVHGARLLRCVDVIGSLLEEELVGRLQQLLSGHGFEYLEIHSCSPESTRLTDAGFVDVSHPDSPVLPGFFEPFINEHRVLRFAHWIASDTLHQPHLFLADSDQDRPNQ